MKHIAQKPLLGFMITSTNGNISRVTVPLWGESTDHRWIPLKKASDAELWCFLSSTPEQTVEQTIETPVIWDAFVLIMTSLLWTIYYTVLKSRFCSSFEYEHPYMKSTGARSSYELQWLRLHYLVTAGTHYNDVIMRPMASQIISLTIVYSTVYSCEDQSHQTSASLASVRGIHR